MAFTSRASRRVAEHRGERVHQRAVENVALGAAEDRTPDGALSSRSTATDRSTSRPPQRSPRRTPFELHVRAADEAVGAEEREHRHVVALAPSSAPPERRRPRKSPAASPGAPTPTPPCARPGVDADGEDPAAGLRAELERAHLAEQVARRSRPNRSAARPTSHVLARPGARNASEHALPVRALARAGVAARRCRTTASRSSARAAGSRTVDAASPDSRRGHRSAFPCARARISSISASPQARPRRAGAGAAGSRPRGTSLRALVEGAEPGAPSVIMLRPARRGCSPCCGPSARACACARSRSSSPGSPASCCAS